eukprot:TRINITY_DN21193_c0_g2_i1.p1 TRINITY_DN21193_c0_g2~~TRINITY_DN21193_c0_g2_i1.p1  ORF type:complete len:994 (+),score=168.96 TRINITY_DN21193_c0_g2_i1:72-3053(+)
MDACVGRLGTSGDAAGVEALRQVRALRQELMDTRAALTATTQELTTARAEVKTCQQLQMQLQTKPPEAYHVVFTRLIREHMSDLEMKMKDLSAQLAAQANQAPATLPAAAPTAVAQALVAQNASEAPALVDSPSSPWRGKGLELMPRDSPESTAATESSILANSLLLKRMEEVETLQREYSNKLEDLADGAVSARDAKVAATAVAVKVEAALEDVSALKAQNVELMGAELPNVKEQLAALSESALPALDRRLLELEAAQAKDGADIEVVEEELAGKELPLTRHRLDNGDSIALQESIWEACVFVGCEFVGFDVSFILCVSVLMNAAVQIGFIVIVFMYMLPDPVSDDQLHNLLRFRLAIGHSVRFADETSKRSLISEVCTGTTRLSSSANQIGLFEDMSEFYSKGVGLCILAHLMWFASIMKDMNSTLNLARALVCAPHAPTTEVVIFDESDHVDADALLKLMVQTRLKYISWTRVVVFCVLVLLPKMIIALLLGFIGMQFLAVTTSLTDLLLNAMALAFILDVDDIFYAIFVPRRIQTIIRNLEPLCLPTFNVKKRLQSSSHVFCKLLTIIGLVAVVYFIWLVPFFERLKQGQLLLCSGNLDFVYAKDPSTGVLTVTKSFSTDRWTNEEEYLLQVAHPELMTGAGVSTQVLEMASSNKTSVVIVGNVSNSADFTQSPPAEESFDQILRLSYYTTRDAASLLKCVDHENAPQDDAAIESMLSQITGRNVSSCSDVPPILCKFMNMTELRALCPVRCACQDFLAPFKGFFAGPNWGCPKSCEEIMRAKAEYDLAEGYYQKCDDVPSESWQTQFKIHTEAYFLGLFEWLGAHRQKREYMAAMSVLGEEVLRIPASKHSDFVDDIMSGEMVKSSFQGLLLKGIPHPRKLKGCKFWTSWELQYILGVDLCQVGSFRSLRFLCPKTCKCTSAPYMDAGFFKGAVNGTLDAERLGPAVRSECPSSCSKMQHELVAHKGGARVMDMNAKEAAMKEALGTR